MNGACCVSAAAGTGGGGGFTTVDTGLPQTVAWQPGRGLVYVSYLASNFYLRAMTGSNASLVLSGNDAGGTEWSASGVAAGAAFYGCGIAVQPGTGWVYWVSQFESITSTASTFRYAVQAIDNKGLLQTLAGRDCVQDRRNLGPSGQGCSCLPAPGAAPCAAENLMLMNSDTEFGTDMNALVIAFSRDGRTLFVVTSANATEPYDNVTVFGSSSSSSSDDFIPGTGGSSYIAAINDVQSWAAGISATGLGAEQSASWVAAITPPTSVTADPKTVLIYSLAVSAAGVLLAADAGNNAVYSITPATTTVVITQPDISKALALCAHPTSADVLFVADDTRVLRVSVSAGTFTTVAGTSSPAAFGFSGDGGAAISAFTQPLALAIDPSGQILYFTDGFFSSIRVVDLSSGIIDTVPTRGEISGNPTGYLAAAWSFGGLVGVAPAAPPPNGDGQTLYLANTLQNVVAAVSPLGELSIAAGRVTASGSLNFAATGDGGPAVAATLVGAQGVAVSPDGTTLFVAPTVAGLGLPAGSPKAVRAVNLTSRTIHSVGLVASSPAGFLSSSDALYIALDDENGAQILKMSTTTGIVTPYVSNFRRYSDRSDVTLAPGVVSGGGLCHSPPAASQNLPTALTLAGYCAGAGILAFVQPAGGRSSAPEDAAGLYVVDALNHVITKWSGNATTAQIIAGDLGKPCAEGTSCGDGSAATASHLSTPLAVAVHPFTWDIFISDQSGSVLRIVSNATRLIRTVTGTYGSSGVGDGLLGNVQQLAFSWTASGVSTNLAQLYAADLQYKSVLLILAKSETPQVQCPAGYYCSCGRNAVACPFDGKTFCPPNAAAPLAVSLSYMAVAASAPFNGSAIALNAIAQTTCPVGMYCPAGSLPVPCPGGSYGTQLGQVALSDCEFCATGTYIAEAGASSPSGASLCTACPLGSYSSNTAASKCALCPPGTFGTTSHSGSSTGGSTACAACPAGTASLFGSPACFNYRAGVDVLTTSDSTAVLESVVTVTDGNLGSRELLMTVLSIALPIALFSLMPYALVLCAARGLCCSPSFARRTNYLAIIDQYALLWPSQDGAFAVVQRTPAGGALFLVGVGVVLALSAWSLCGFFYSNNMLVSSLLPTQLGLITSYRSLPRASPNATLASRALWSGTTPLADGSGGLAVSVRTHGRLCSTVKATSSDTDAGAFAYSVAFNTTTFEARHDFRCSACSFDALSYVAATFDLSCQSFAVSLTAVGVGGGVTTSQVYIDSASPISAAALSFPLVLQVISDTVSGAPRAGDGLVVGGRSAAGYAVGGATAPVLSAATPGAMSVSLSLSISLQQEYVLYSLTPLLSTVGLVTALTAWSGLLFSFGLALVVVHRMILGAPHIAAEVHAANERAAAMEAVEAAVKAATDAAASAAAAAAAGADKSAAAKPPPPPRDRLRLAFGATSFAGRKPPGVSGDEALAEHMTSAERARAEYFASLQEYSSFRRQVEPERDAVLAGDESIKYSVGP